MNRNLLAVACAAALAAEALSPQPRWDPRHFKLDASTHEGAIRFLAGAVSLDGDRPSSWVTVTRTGTFRDPRYGEFEITREMLLAMVESFKQRVYGQDVMIDVAHQSDQGAAGKIVELAVDGSKLRARVGWTPYGVEAIKSCGYQYLSERRGSFDSQDLGDAKGEDGAAVRGGEGEAVGPARGLRSARSRNFTPDGRLEPLSSTACYASTSGLRGLPATARFGRLVAPTMLGGEPCLTRSTDASCSTNALRVTSTRRC
jgi:hypothetical protein